MQISAAVKLIFILGKELSPGEKSWVQKKQESTSFRSTLNTREMFGVRSHMAIALVTLIVNTAMAVTLKGRH